MRVGSVTTCTRSAPGDHVMLGGVRIPHARGVMAHSDGDVVLHALCDALLGAMGLGDIGQHFPDTDPRWKGADSRRFLRHCARAACTSTAGGSSMPTSRCSRRRRASGPTACRCGRTSPTTSACASTASTSRRRPCEGLGALGRGEGLACQAVVLLAHGENAHKHGHDGS